jgi:hypothetical protein
VKIVLKDGTEIQIAQATYDGHYVIDCANRAAYDAVWDNFTTENLEDFRLVDNNDNMVLRVLYIRLTSTQAILNPDNTVTGHFYLSGGTVLPNEYEQAGRILLGEEETT